MAPYNASSVPAMVPGLIAASFLLVAVRGCTVTIQNHCSYTVTSCAQSQSSPIAQYQLSAGQSQTLDFGSGCSWPSAAVWASVTGQCVAAGGNPSAASDRNQANLAEFNIVSPTDYYDLSNVNAYTIGLKIQPVGSSWGAPSCTISDIRSFCTANNQLQTLPSGALTCVNTDGSAGLGPTDGTREFKAACPSSYSYTITTTPLPDSLVPMAPGRHSAHLPRAKKGRQTRLGSRACTSSPDAVYQPPLGSQIRVLWMGMIMGLYALQLLGIGRAWMEKIVSDVDVAASTDFWVGMALGHLPLVVVVMVYLYSCSLVVKRANVQVPRGRFWQIPVVGESFQLLSGDPDRFMLPKIRKYGKNFRTHLFGHPTVCVTKVEATRFVLQHPNLFGPNYPASQNDILGPDAISQVDGEVHNVYRKIIKSSLTTDALKNLASHIDEEAKNWVAAMADKNRMETVRSLKDFTFFVAMRLMCDDWEPSVELDRFRQDAATVEHGLMVVPLKVPGSAWSKAVEGSGKAFKFLQHLIDKRRGEEGRLQHHDMLQQFLTWESDDGEKLSDAQIRSNMLTVLFAAHDTTTCALMWVLYNMCQYPQLAKRVRDEHEEYARSSPPDSPIKWEQMSRALSYTSRFLQETMRVANVAAFSPRKAKEDVVLDGMLIPKGWQVLTWYRYFHLDSDVYPDPLRFDPDRFETTPKFNTYTPFGNGDRVCVGKDLARQQILIFLHRFLPVFQFESAGVIPFPKQHFWPIPYPADGFPLKLRKKEKSKIEP